MTYTRNPNSILAGTALRQTPISNLLTPPGALAVEFHANVASTEQLGVVQVGSNLHITPEGVLSVVFPSNSATCSTILVDSDYIAANTDCYIGVNSSGPVKITLPVPIENGKQIIVKAEMGSPIGTRKVTIVTSDGSLIDGSASRIITVPYGSSSFIARANTWNII